MGQLNGYVQKLGERDYTFSPYTQGIMEAFEDWQVDRVMSRTMKTAEKYRKRARELESEAGAIREAGIEDGDKWGPAKKAEMQAAWNDKAGEMQSLQMEARRMVEEVNKDAAAGVYGFYGEHCTNARRQVDSVTYLCWLCMRETNEGITLKAVRELSDKYYVLMAKALASANGDAPKNETAAEVASTLPPAQTTSGNPSTGVTTEQGSAAA